MIDRLVECIWTRVRVCERAKSEKREAGWEVVDRVIKSLCEDKMSEGEREGVYQLCVQTMHLL